MLHRLMHRIHSRLWLGTELLFLMVGLPAVLYFVLPIRYLLPVIWLAALGCHFGAHALSLPPREWWMRHQVTWNSMRPILLRFVVIAILLTISVWLIAPTLLFSFVREKPLFWLLIIFLYPLLSVVPQEIIFRRFFFTRYEKLFDNPWLLVIASGLVFSWAHILFHNWIAPIMCIVGGIMFAATYRKNRSLMLVSLEHALYGDFIFTVGLGRYFFHGAVGH